jgi:hypothetical protein
VVDLRCVASRSLLVAQGQVDMPRSCECEAAECKYTTTALHERQFNTDCDVAPGFERVVLGTGWADLACFVLFISCSATEAGQWRRGREIATLDKVR